MGVTIGKLRFPTQSAASRHFEMIRNRYALGATVSDNDAEVLFNLLEHHAHRGAPSRQETQKFIVDASAWGRPCFYAVTVKGSRFALPASRSAAYNSTPVGAAKLAFRLLAKNETKLARNRLRGMVKCRHCAASVASSDVEMDHYPERFEELLARFLNSKGLAIAMIKTISEGEGKVALENNELKSAWMTFHRAHAALVPSCMACNRRG
jgi:hypothetical protein